MKGYQILKFLMPVTCFFYVKYDDFYPVANNSQFIKSTVNYRTRVYSQFLILILEQSEQV